LAYLIVRTKKIKSFGALSRSARHTFREQPTPNADEALSHKNRSLGAKSSREVCKAFRARIPKERRKDAVIGIEYLITASPEAFRRHGGTLDEMGDGLFNDAVAALKKRHGAENVVCSAVHLDERTPHMVAYVVPMTKDGKLNCKSFLGSSKLLSAMQDEFYQACGKSRGLERGIKGSKAKHQKVSRYYANLAKAGEVPTLSKLDYAAAAIGIKTPSWKKAQEVIKANAGVVVEARAEKREVVKQASLLARFTEKAKAVLNLEDGLKRKERALERRSEDLDRREGGISREEGTEARLRAEIEALERRLAPKEEKPMPSRHEHQKKGPKGPGD
jgi:hypothetical protein